MFYNKKIKHFKNVNRNLLIEFKNVDEEKKLVNKIYNLRNYCIYTLEEELKVEEKYLNNFKIKQYDIDVKINGQC